MVGCSGSGKTTLARSLAEALGSPHTELDSIYHQPGWTPLTDEEFRRRVAAVVDADRWVVDGTYSVVQDIVWGRADTVVWFDLPYLTVMSRAIRRTVRRTITREELWNGNQEPLSNLYSLKPEKSIIAWAAVRHKVYRRRFSEAEHDPRWASLRFIRLRSQSEADAFVAGVASSARREE